MADRFELPDPKVREYVLQGIQAGASTRELARVLDVGPELIARIAAGLRVQRYSNMVTRQRVAALARQRGHRAA